MESEEKRKKLDYPRTAMDQFFDRGSVNNGKREGDTEEKCRDEEESRLYSRLHSQMGSSEQDLHASCSSKCPYGERRCGKQEGGVEDIARELRAVKRQNLITHCLLAVMIVVTGTWQISEVSLLLSAKEKLCNPLKAVGDLLRNSVMGRGKKLEIEGPPLPPIGATQIPFVNLPYLPLNEDGH